MENLSVLPRTVSSGASSAELKAPRNNDDSGADNGTSSGFKDVLNEEVQQRETPVRAEKTSKNQTDTDDVEQAEARVQAEEQNTDSESAQPLADAAGLLIEPSAEQAAVAIGENTDQQTEQADGNNLPVAAMIVIDDMDGKAENIPSAEGSQRNAAAFNIQMQAAQQQNTPAKTADSTIAGQLPADANVDKAAGADLIKTMPGNKLQADIPMGEGRLNPASVVQQISAASQLQQVPLTTANAGIHLNTPAVPTDAALNSPATLHSSIQSPVQSSAWAQGVGEKVSIMMANQMQRAEIKLNPANLGPMEIHLSLKDDKASINFVSQHLPVREALDQAMPRLREMLEQQGLNLVNVDVSQHSFGQQAESDHSDTGSQTITEPLSNTEEQEITTGMTQNIRQIDVPDGVSIFA